MRNISLQKSLLMFSTKINYLVRECTNQIMRTIECLFGVLDQERGISQLEVFFFMSRSDMHVNQVLSEALMTCGALKSWNIHILCQKYGVTKTYCIQTVL